jgi:hypothetical protein
MCVKVFHTVFDIFGVGVSQQESVPWVTEYIFKVKVSNLGGHPYDRNRVLRPVSKTDAAFAVELESPKGGGLL